MSPPTLDGYAEAIGRGDVDPRQGLPDGVFAFALAIVPMINVDLLVRDDNGRILLAWRDDAYGRGWHIPGGIIRVREAFADRVAAVARLELGASVEADAVPCRVEQLTDSERGHFVSLLFRCRLVSEPDAQRLSGDGEPTSGQLRWIAGPPTPLYPAHAIYADLFATGQP